MADIRRGFASARINNINHCIVTMEQRAKIAFELHEGEKSTKKIWRFDVSSGKSFTKSLLVNEIEGLFPQKDSALASVIVMNWPERK